MFKIILLLSEDIVAHQKHQNARDTFPQPNGLPENLLSQPNGHEQEEILLTFIKEVNDLSVE